MINQLHRVEFVCRFLCWSHKLVLHSTTRKERIYWIRKSTRKKKGMMKQKSFNFFCPWSWRKSNTMSWKKGIEGKMLQKRKKKKKKKERKEKCQLFKDFESLPWEKVLYILIYSLKSCDLYHESTPTKKNPKKTYAFLEFSSPSSHPPPCRSGLCLLFPESSVTASVEEEVSKELGVEGCSWLAVPFPESLSTGEMTSDEEQDMSKAFERVL